ncbi:hypothetical protein AMURIS_00914 [Acetatifactor muris]|uniref:Uncharacterized protein n=2 Tax=Acetatifactor muris TaxID=879566 RepID=A0A2K4ZCL3_9FIRM|nr:hypothetical protein AMURIS_00914 [Acetatifactor muris]
MQADRLSDFELENLEREFQNPSSQYRGTPFWAWNCDMTEAKVIHTLADFQKMRMGGAYLHSRTGMNMPYLGKKFMDMVLFAHEKAMELGLKICLYDEDRWPSGYAGGLVTKNEAYRSRFLLFSPSELTQDELWEEPVNRASAQAAPGKKRRLIARYRVKLTDGWLSEYKRIKSEEKLQEEWKKDGWKIWYAYLEISGDSPWFNNQSYVDTLNPQAIREFIHITYETYEKVLGKEFGKSVPMIFTDEPQFTFKTQLGYAEEEKCQTIPYTDDFEETYKATYGEGFLDYLPEIFWDLPNNQISVHRYRYHDHVCQRFTESYADQIGRWCEEHGILLTGHMMREPFLECQTMALGEAMRSYRSFGIPGMDILCDRRELTTAKQVQSAVHQFNAPGMTSEIYGVTNWDFDFRGHKMAGDWQAALGVTCRAHHLTWTSMSGEAKRDYPASIGHQSPWYEEYSYIEDYFARLNTVLTRGKPCVKVAVIHPIESYWLYWGTREHTDEIRREREENFVNLVRWLLLGLIDFDFLSESLLEDFVQEDQEGFQAGAMKYDVVLIPDCMTLRRSTLERLREFRSREGKVIFAGRIPELVDGMPDVEVVEFAGRCSQIRYSRQAILEALEPYRSLDIRDSAGKRSANLLYQMREEGTERWLFVAHCEKPENPDLAEAEALHFTVPGNFELEKYDALTGSIKRHPAKYEKGKTHWKEVSYEHDSFLYRLFPCGEQVLAETTESGKGERAEKVQKVRIPCLVPVTVHEPNVLLLDRAEYAFDEESWNDEEDILRIDNKFREKSGMPLRTEAFAQPWVETDAESKEREKEKHILHLRFRVEAMQKIEEALLALEQPEHTKVQWNGKAVEINVSGWYVDEDIKTIKLGEVKSGLNILELEIVFNGKIPVENVYLLGDFGVNLRGRQTYITEPVRELAFGDLCGQGLPFYGGNISYHVDFELESSVEDIEIQISKFRAPVICVKMDGIDVGRIAFSPYCLRTGRLDKGQHHLELIVYGNRVNTFGPVHNCNQTEIWIGPDAWRTVGTSWSYEYQLKSTGILISPVITTWN